MKYKEELFWILDKPGTTIHNQDEKFRENKEFVHSLGLKCDCVGWCKLDLKNPKTAEILEKIAAFCKENDWKARAVYTRNYIDIESDWYELVPTKFNDTAIVDVIETFTKDSIKLNNYILRAFHETSIVPKSSYTDLFVPERFRNSCIQQNCNDLDYCWVKDKGKYEAEQYFHIYGKHLISHVAIGENIASSILPAMGGWLSKISEIFHEIQQINLPDCYLAADMPANGIAYICLYKDYPYIDAKLSEDSNEYAYYVKTRKELTRNTILIHKDTAKTLLKDKALSAKNLRPAPIVETLPAGYTLLQTDTIARPDFSFMNKMNLEYEKIKETSRPKRIVSEKDALKVLRKEKKERKDDFHKALSKTKVQEIYETDYRVIVPYYLVANGGYLSDEYELLSYAQAVIENNQFHTQLKTEELLEERPDGIIIAKCPDGDSILLCKNGSVLRFSHEAPEITNQWPSLSHFIIDAINN